MVRRAWWVVLTLAMVLAAQWMMARGHADLAVNEELLAGNPTLHVSAEEEYRGTVIVLHGFGGSKEMMQYWGYALARLGFDVYIPDLPGHGAQTAPMADSPGTANQVRDALVAAGRAEPDRVGLIGHPTSLNPLAPLYDLDAVADAAGRLSSDVGGDVPAGAAPGGSPAWLLLGLAGGVGALPAVAALVRPDPRRSGRRQQPAGLVTGLAAVAVSLLSAVLAVVYLRVPQLGVATLDYLVPYFLVAAVVLLLLRKLWPREFGASAPGEAESVPHSLLRGLAVALAFLGALVPVIHQNVTYFVPTGPRILPLAATALAYWLYAFQEESLKRAVAGGPSPAGLVLGLAAKILMVATWVGAGVLPNPPAHLPAVLPVALGVLVTLEILSGVLAAMRLSALSVALAEAVAVGWTAAVMLPLL